MEINQEIILLILPLIILQLIVLVIAIIDLVRHETNGPKWVWALVIIFINIIGPIIYFIFGRRP